MSSLVSRRELKACGVSATREFNPLQFIHLNFGLIACRGRLTTLNHDGLAARNHIESSWTIYGIGRRSFFCVAIFKGDRPSVAAGNKGEDARNGDNVHRVLHAYIGSAFWSVFFINLNKFSKK